MPALIIVKRSSPQALALKSAATKLVPLRGPSKYGDNKTTRIHNLAVSIISNRNGKSDRTNIRTGINYARRHFLKEPLSAITTERLNKIMTRYETNVETMTQLNAMQKAIVSGLSNRS
jgi:hypothetical protein